MKTLIAVLLVCVAVAGCDLYQVAGYVVQPAVSVPVVDYYYSTPVVAVDTYPSFFFETPVVWDTAPVVVGDCIPGYDCYTWKQAAKNKGAR